MNIGKLEKVDLREVWKDEEKDFSSWLASNLEHLSEAISQNLSLVDTEVKLLNSRFSVDILAENDEGDGVIIQNQLNQTDHKHLGQLLTYLINTDNEIAIWISSSPRQEHINAVNWLNESTDKNVYIVKVEAYRIGDSLAAPFFSVIAAPNEEVKEIGETKTLNKKDKKAIRKLRDEADTIIVPAQQEGFNRVFIGEDKWQAIRINEKRINQIKWIAAYQVAPVSAITHIAKVKEIIPCKDSGKYEVLFQGRAKKIKPILLGDPNRSPQGPVYGIKSRIDFGGILDQVLSGNNFKKVA